MKKFGKPSAILTMLNRKAPDTDKIYKKLKQFLLSDMQIIHQNCLASSFKNEKARLSIATNLLV